MLKKLIKSLLREKNVNTYFWTIRQKALATNKNILSRVINLYKYRRLMNKYNCDIPLSTTLEAAPTFPHFNGILLSKNAKIGKNCTIFHQVSVASNTLKDAKHPGSPTIGDNVYIGVGAKIVGGITIGNNVRIGANCVVVKDVPDNTTIVMQAPRMIPHTDTKDNTFISINDYMPQNK